MSMYDRVPTARVPRSIFNLSFTRKTTGVMGKLYPICVKNMIPGDTFKITQQVYLKFMPSINPVFHDIYLKTRWFFVPHRLVDENFEEAVTGGEDGKSVVTFPVWNPDALSSKASKTDVCVHDTLWDHLGYPLLDTETSYSGSLSSTNAFDDICMPVAYPLRAINRTWNDWFRDEETQTKIIENETETGFNYNLLRVNWRKDRFTSAGQEEQRGTAPALPLSGTLPVLSSYTSTDGDHIYAPGVKPTISTSYSVDYVQPAFQSVAQEIKTTPELNQPVVGMHINAKDIGTFTIKDLRITNAIQKWQERNEECGSRYGEYLRAQYGVYPRDERLQRPEYIGGSSVAVNMSPVTQQSESTAGNPLGKEVVRATALDSAYIGTYKAYEHGTLLGFMYVVPRNSYITQGFPAEWMWHDKFELPNPLFAHLGNMPVRLGEIYAKGTKQFESGGTVTKGDDTIFGWQGKDDEYRDSRDETTAGFRSASFNNWTFDRSFADYPGNNSQFRQVNVDSNTVFAYQDGYQFAAYAGIGIKAVRPLPKFPTPML